MKKEGQKVLYPGTAVMLQCKHIQYDCVYLLLNCDPGMQENGAVHYFTFIRRNFHRMTKLQVNVTLVRHEHLSVPNLYLGAA